jgi:ankyrin repeat protein
MWAAEHGDVALLRRAIRAGTDARAVDTKFDVTALECAILAQNRECAELMISFGGDPNRPNARGETPLALIVDLHANPGDLPKDAEDKNRAEWIKMLRTHGARPEVADQKGRSPISLAQLNGLPECAAALR